MQLRLVLLLALLAAAPAAAQEGSAPTGTTGSEAPAPVPAIDVSRLPVSLGRIGRELRQATVREERDGLNLRYTIEVYGQAPRIQLFTPEDNLRYGPVPRSAPSHADMIQMMTPLEFRAPVMDFSALMRWLADRDKK